MFSNFILPTENYEEEIGNNPFTKTQNNRDNEPYIGHFIVYKQIYVHKSVQFWDFLKI
jgi:hypothetical protein